MDPQHGQPPLLDISNLCFSYFHNGKADMLLRDLSLTVKEGELVCLIGRSGCGKSTLLKIIAGFLTPSSGRCCLDGMKIGKPGPDRCVVFQEDALFPWLTVNENIAFGLSTNRTTRHTRNGNVSQVLAMTGLIGYEDYLPKALSGGMKQRVALARVLIRSPRILLMDEPFGALDAQSRDEMQELLLTIARQRRQTILFVTHDVREAVTIADRVMMLDRQNGTICSDIDIPLDRPRRLQPRFQHYCDQLYQLFN